MNSVGNVRLQPTFDAPDHPQGRDHPARLRASGPRPTACSTPKPATPCSSVTRFPAATSLAPTPTTERCARWWDNLESARQATDTNRFSVVGGITRWLLHGSTGPMSLNWQPEDAMAPIFRWLPSRTGETTCGSPTTGIDAWAAVPVVRSAAWRWNGRCRNTSGPASGHAALVIAWRLKLGAEHRFNELARQAILSDLISRRALLRTRWVPARGLWVGAHGRPHHLSVG